MLPLAAWAAVVVGSPRPRPADVRPPAGAAAEADRPARPAPLPTSSASSASVARGSGASAVRAPTVDEAGRIRVPVSDAVPARLPAPGKPTGWDLTQFAGDASVELVRNDGRLALRLRSERASFAVHRDVVVDLRQHPMLRWSWKVVRLPSGGDVREAGRDDQAAQLYVVFPRWPSPRSTSDVVGYVWDSHAPTGTTLTHPRAPNVRIVVLQSGPARLDAWVPEERNVAADYQTLFGRPAPRVGKVALMSDSNDTRSDTEALFGDLFFARPGAAQHTEIPTPMLR